ncbi:MAG: glycosyltransferase family 39 protein [Anaerolineae bacterium]|nr:glycosyltransferase family 39 protein [Anaerolineae bacterium]
MKRLIPPMRMGLDSRLARLLVIPLMLCLFAQLLFSAGRKSPTFDEPNHLTRGYAYLETGDLRLSRDEGHPPLFNLICALPLALLPDLSLPTHLPSWEVAYRNAFAIEFTFSGKVPVARLFFLGRLPVILTTLCLAALIMRWARELYGSWGGVVALVFCAFDPNIVAHGRLVTTDMGMTFFLFLAAYVFWRFLQRPSFPLLALSGVAAGLAQSAKFSAILVLPFFGLLGLIETFHPKGSLRLPGRARTGQALLVLGGVMGAVVVCAGLTIWVIYGLDVGPPAGWSISLPAPGYVEGLLRTVSHASEVGHPTFLLGQHSTQGWWYYFPVAFALKTPLPAMLALVGAWVTNVWKRSRRAEWPLLLIPAVYVAISLTSSLNIGYRHLLPILPFLWVYVGRIGALPVRAQAGTTTRWSTWAVAVLCVLGLWLVVGTVNIYPDYLAYFNLFAGGPDGGWRYLVDSNLDWGQELPAIAAYAEQRSDARLHLSWFGSTYPHLYGLDLEYRLLPSHFSYPYPQDAARSAYNPLYPAPGLYAIGATNLQRVGLAAGDVYARFRAEEPVARVGHSVMIFEVPDPPPEAADRASPTCISELRFKDLAPETVDLSLGRGPGAVKWFDYRTSFIVPGRGDSVYVLPGPPLGFVPAWQEWFLQAAKTIHVQREEDRYPPATVYWLDRALMDGWQESVFALASSEPVIWSPSIVFGADAEAHPLLSPVSFEYGLELAGYAFVSSGTMHAGETLELATIWRATAEMPADASDLKMFVHLLDDHSQVWAAEDRLDLHPPTWESGDVLIQYHRLPLALDAPSGAYQLEVGLYTGIRMQRLAVYDQGVPVADRLLLRPVEVMAP